MMKFLLPTWRTAQRIWASEMHFFVEIQRVPHQKFNRSRSWTTTFIWPCGLMCFLTFFMPRYLFFDTVQATLLMQSEAHALGVFVHVCIFLGLGGGVITFLSRASLFCYNMFLELQTRSWCYASNMFLELQTRSWCYASNMFLELQTRSWCYASNMFLELQTRSWCYASSMFLELQTRSWCYASNMFLELQTCSWCYASNSQTNPLRPWKKKGPVSSRWCAKKKVVSQNSKTLIFTPKISTSIRRHNARQFFEISECRLYHGQWKVVHHVVTDELSYHKSTANIHKNQTLYMNDIYIYMYI